MTHPVEVSSPGQGSSRSTSWPSHPRCPGHTQGAVTLEDCPGAEISPVQRRPFSSFVWVQAEQPGKVQPLPVGDSQSAWGPTPTAQSTPRTPGCGWEVLPESGGKSSQSQGLGSWRQVWIVFQDFLRVQAACKTVLTR